MLQIDISTKHESAKMNSKRLNICILHAAPFDPDMPARPAVTEIYGECMPRFGHRVTWITPSGEKGKGVQEEFFRGVHIYIIPRPMASLLPLRIFNFISSAIRKYRLLTNIYNIEKCDIIQVRNDDFGALLALFMVYTL